MNVVWGVRVVVVLLLERVLVVGGEMVVATRALAGMGADLDQISVAIDQETGPAEVRCQPKGAVEPLSGHAFGFRRLPDKEGQCSLARTEKIRPAMS